MSIPLLQNAYEQSKQLYNQNKSSWYGFLQRILQNFPTISQLKGKKISKNSLNRQIKEGFLELWKNQMKQYSEGKLRTYTTFKVHFGFENYLSVIGNFEHRRCLTKLRISAHRLHIETGRSSIEAPSIYYLRWCSEVVPEVIACATGNCITGYDVTGSCITGSCITGNDVTGSREPEMKGRSFPAFFLPGISPELL
jgi:hypothetical protein